MRNAYLSVKMHTFFRTYSVQVKHTQERTVSKPLNRTGDDIIEALHRATELNECEMSS